MNLKICIAWLAVGWMVIRSACAQSLYTVYEFPEDKRVMARQNAQACLENYYNSIGYVLNDMDLLLKFQRLYLSSNGYTYQSELTVDNSAGGKFPKNLNSYLSKVREAYAGADMDVVGFKPSGITFNDSIFKTTDSEMGCTLSAEYFLSVTDDDVTFIRRKCRAEFYMENVLKPMDVKINGIEVLQDLEIRPHTPTGGVSDNPLTQMSIGQLSSHVSSLDEMAQGNGVINEDNVAYYKELTLRNYWFYALLVADYYMSEGDNELAADYLRWNAVRGEEESIAALGSLLLEKGEFRNGIYWTNKAAEKGSPVAQYNMGRSYLLGYGVPEDWEKATYWMKKSAQQGDEKAQTMLALIYRTEGFSSKDLDKSFYWMQKAAEKGNADALYQLAEYHLKGIGTTADKVKAKDCYYKAALAGNDDAQYEMGLLEMEAKNCTEALVWFVNAAEQGNAKAQFQLGVMYQDGECVDKDLKQSNYWYKKAAKEE